MVIKGAEMILQLDLKGKNGTSIAGFAERVLVDGLLLTPTDARIWDGRKWSWWPSFPYTYYIERQHYTS